MFHQYAAQMARLHACICRPFTVGDAVIEPIEIILVHPGGVAACPPHSHTWFEFNYVYEGTMKTSFDGAMLDVQAGEFFLIPPGVVHAHEYVPQRPHRDVCLRWTIRPAAVDRGSEAAAEWDTAAGQATAEQAEAASLDSLYSSLLRLSRWEPGCYPDRCGLGERLAALFRGAERQASPASLQLAFAGIVLALADLDLTAEGRKVPPVEPADHALLRKVDLYLGDAESTGRAVSVRELAASMHMSYGHLARRYKQLTGRTVLDRLMDMRLERACALLAGSETPIAQVAEKAGFASLPYFSRSFKAAYGISPRQYRARDPQPRR